MTAGGSCPLIWPLEVLSPVLPSPARRAHRTAHIWPLWPASQVGGHSQAPAGISSLNAQATISSSGQSRVRFHCLHTLSDACRHDGQHQQRVRLSHSQLFWPKQHLLLLPAHSAHAFKLSRPPPAEQCIAAMLGKSACDMFSDTLLRELPLGVQLRPQSQQKGCTRGGPK